MHRLSDQESLLGVFNSETGDQIESKSEFSIDFLRASITIASAAKEFFDDSWQFEDLN